MLIEFLTVVGDEEVVTGREWCLMGCDDVLFLDLWLFSLVYSVHDESS